MSAFFCSIFVIAHDNRSVINLNIAVFVFKQGLQPLASVKLNAGASHSLAIYPQCSNSVLRLVKTHANGGGGLRNGISIFA